MPLAALSVYPSASNSLQAFRRECGEPTNDDAIVVLEKNACSIAEAGSHVTAKSGSHVAARKGARITAEAGSQVFFVDSADVTSEAGVDLTAFDGATKCTYWVSSSMSIAWPVGSRRP